MAKPPVVVLAPDSFKGSATASEVCAALELGLRRVSYDAEVRARPMADGGEGTLDAVLGAGEEPTRGTRGMHAVTSAVGGPCWAEYGIVDDAGRAAALVEVAQVLASSRKDRAFSVPVVDRSTFGVGELLRHLLDAGLRRFWIGLGGTSTNDGGAGMLAALGVRLLDAAGEPVDPTPSGLASLARIDVSGLDPRLAASSLTILSDVDRPLCGPDGATATFGPQKGLPEDDVARVDDVLADFADHAERAFRRCAAAASGAGAAGGLGFALQLLGAEHRSGAEFIADLVDLDGALRDADWVLTGEGRTDGQTLAGKAPSVVARRARRAGVAVTCLSGAIDPAALPAMANVFDGCFALPSGPASLDACMQDVATLVADRAEQLARLWSAGRRGR